MVCTCAKASTSRLKWWLSNRLVVIPLLCAKREKSRVDVRSRSGLIEYERASLAKLRRR